MERPCPQVECGMSMQEVRSLLGEPDREHAIALDHQVLTSWIYHTNPDPMCVWFDAQGRVKLASR